MDKVRQYTNQQRKRIFDARFGPDGYDIAEWNIGLDDRLRNLKNQRMSDLYSERFKRAQKRAGIPDRFTTDDF
jgi:hypothetical protein